MLEPELAVQSIAYAIAESRDVFYDQPARAWLERPYAQQALYLEIATRLVLKLGPPPAQNTKDFHLMKVANELARRLEPSD